MKKFEKTEEKYHEVANQLTNECKEYVLEQLEKKEGKRIDVYNEYQNEPISITYDGGNHPEYASDAFSSVESVEINDGGYICIETEDGEMDFDFLNVEDMLSITHLVSWYSDTINYRVKWLLEDGHKEDLPEVVDVPCCITETLVEEYIEEVYGNGFHVESVIKEE